MAQLPSSVISPASSATAMNEEGWAHDGIANLMLPSRHITVTELFDLAIEADRCGWTSVWVAETLGVDAFVMLGALTRSTSLDLGTAIVLVSTSSIAVLGMSASTLAALAPGRITLGLGVSTPAIVGDRHGRPVHRPLQDTATVLSILRSLLDGETVNSEVPRLRNLRIDSPAVVPRLVLAALGPRMTELAYQQADGLSLNMVPFDIARSRVLDAKLKSARSGFEVMSQVRVAVDPTPEQVFRLKREVASYMRVPAYARALANMDVDTSAIQAAGDLDEAAHRLSREELERFAVIGDVDHCVESLRSLSASGVRPLVLLQGPAHQKLFLVRTLPGLLRASDVPSPGG